MLLESPHHVMQETGHHVLKTNINRPDRILVSDDVRSWLCNDGWGAWTGGLGEWLSGITGQWYVSLLGFSLTLTEDLSSGKCQLGFDSGSALFIARSKSLFGVYEDGEAEGDGTRPAGLVGKTISIGPWPGQMGVQFDGGLSGWANGIDSGTWDGIALSPEPLINSGTPQGGYFSFISTWLTVNLGWINPNWIVSVAYFPLNVPTWTATWSKADTTALDPSGTYSYVSGGPGGTPGSISVTEL